MTTASEAFSQFGATLDFEDLPGDVHRCAQLRLLDTFGCALAAHAVGELAGLPAVLAAGGTTQPGATAIGHDRGLTPHDAALINGALCHALDYDDTHPGAIAHVSAVVIPAALAVAERFDAPGADFISSMIVGYEVVSRIGAAVHGEFHARGQHATSMCGVFGAAAVACRARGLDAATTANALGIAGSLASGTLEYLADGSSTKRLHPGFAAHGGIIATALASGGATGPKTVLEGDFGLYRAFLGRDDPPIADQTRDLGDRWETLRIASKPYPACHFSHACVRALAQIVAAEGLDATEITDLVAIVPEAFVPHVLEPVDHKRRPRTAYEARFSLQYALGAMLVHGRLDVDSFDDARLNDPALLAAAAKVRYETRDFGEIPVDFRGGVSVSLTDGRTLTARLDDEASMAADVMSENDIVEKWRRNASLALSAGDVDDLEQQLLSIHEAPEVSGLTTALSRLGHSRGREASEAAA